MARWDTIQVEGHPMRTYLDVPAGGGAVPGVVVIMHGPGLDRFVEDRVENLARAGYAAIAPDLYHRQAPSSDMMARIGQLRDLQLVADVDAAAAHLRRVPDARVGDLAILGFCMGGRITYLLAGARPALWKAAGVFYGGNIMKPWGEPGPSPFELTREIACPVIGFFGIEDANPSPDDVRKLDAELTKHGKPHEFHSYEGAGHAFLNFTNAERYREKQGADAWQKMLGFLDRHLKGKGA
jgi:carboxymethylenebutenolidase